jgi:hypothetical protein
MKKLTIGHNPFPSRFNAKVYRLASFRKRSQSSFLRAKPATPPCKGGWGDFLVSPRKYNGTTKLAFFQQFLSYPQYPLASTQFCQQSYLFGPALASTFHAKMRKKKFGSSELSGEIPGERLPENTTKA